MPGEMKLTYFHLRGRAELSRLLFKLAGKEFNDNRVTGESWQQFKPTAPKGQVPVLEVDGKMICESNAICRYLAREFGLYGSNNWEAAICDQILETIAAIVQSAVQLKFSAKTEEDKAECLKKAISHVEGLEKLASSFKKGKFILGDNASLADAAIQNSTEFCSGLPDFKLEAYPTINAIATDFAAIPAIAEWIKTRPESSM
ncbi:hematopoietic prostaglandin D synthase-like [Watersipora subatra]|uniref:hematopoietic prostaglandin D synthase-like n=1 Tax=Watersipora subatra TaxID=2589382 RepID=UPI00355C1E9C